MSWRARILPAGIALETHVSIASLDVVDGGLAWRARQHEKRAGVGWRGARSQNTPCVRDGHVQHARGWPIADIATLNVPPFLHGFTHPPGASGSFAARPLIVDSTYFGAADIARGACAPAVTWQPQRLGACARPSSAHGVQGRILGCRRSVACGRVRSIGLPARSTVPRRSRRVHCLRTCPLPSWSVWLSFPNS